MNKYNLKLKFLMFLYKRKWISSTTVINYGDISRATFYRYKKKLNAISFTKR